MVLEKEGKLKINVIVQRTKTLSAYLSDSYLEKQNKENYFYGILTILIKYLSNGWNSHENLSIDWIETRLFTIPYIKYKILNW